MQRVRVQFLSKPLNTVLHPVSNEVQKVVKEEQFAADEALKYKGEIEQPVKQLEKEPELQTELPKPVKSQSAASRILQINMPWRLVGGIIGVLGLIILSVWGGMSIFNNLPTAASAPTQTSQSIALQASQATKTQRPQSAITNTPPLNRTFVSPTTKSSITVEPTPIFCVVNAFAGGGGANIREAPNGKILATVLNGTVVTVIPNETQTVNGVIWIHVFVLVDDVHVYGWMVNLCG